MNSAFYNCKSLESLPDLSKWTIKNVKDISGLFQGCCSLKSLPDLSKWETSKIENMNGTFNLQFIPEISEYKECDSELNKFEKNSQKNGESSTSISPTTLLKIKISSRYFYMENS